ncbi:hypothetical protein AUK41_03785 [Candidatus Berkelbacteria bacterium CG2_30_43_20]|uniref:Integrase catalytic domain-containing protein n=1 Tax=Candidatus Berkelbacteria bacterium CG10_big_fil_rev_8_21_14_0_10_43_14 TaxID=1974515 RepID=A0A2M6RBA4_9BACT|nr:MAG: hypothetical protein AUK41_03785 [Candidatus Berkelbacteria bacterium CG2_30_43_20]PIS07300.1 MAG: hypothetical protein COT79_00005 [Candidatus Berkelbacteria bacterium CG10_big_fil_rev_8_21_14_0_10_43_14]
MTKMSKREYLIQLKKKYWRSGKKQKTQLLDDFCEFTKYHRKYALSLLNKPLPKKWKRYQPRTKHYDSATVDALLILWRTADEICAERLHPFIEELLDKLIECQEITVSPEVRLKLLKISLGTVKKIISKTKHRTLVKIGGTTKPGSLLKSQIAIRYLPWEEVDPGWCETDTVAHCGGDVSGEFIYSLNVIDIATGWSEQAAIWGKGEQATKEQVDRIRSRMPFTLLGLNPDNGSEFINWQLFRYCQKNEINLTRSRAYHKNDNAHIEQKNWTAVRQLLGYSRFDKRIQQEMFNDLYVNEWRFYLNFFQPTMKLKEKIKDTKTGRSRKKYYQAKTPFRRLLEHPKTTQEQKDLLLSIYASLNPIQLQQQINKKLELIRKTLK